MKAATYVNTLKFQYLLLRILHNNNIYVYTLHTQACPFTLEVFTEDCEGEIEIVDLLSFNPVVDPALCRLVMERGVCGEVRDGGGDLLTYTFTTPHLTTIAVENKVTIIQWLCIRGMIYDYRYYYNYHVFITSSTWRG